MGGCLCKKEIRRGSRILFLGIPESGKTTALYRFKLGEFVTTIPTHGFNREAIQVEDKTLDVWDVGARVEDRSDFLYCMNDVSAVVFFIDCSAGEKKLALAINKLEILLSEGELEKCPIAIAANKQDLESEISVSEITRILIQKEYMRYRYWKVFATSSLSEFGLQGFMLLMKWIVKYQGKEKRRPEEKRKPRRRRRVKHSSFTQHANRRDETFHLANKLHVVAEDDYM